MDKRKRGVSAARQSGLGGQMVAVDGWGKVLPVVGMPTGGCVSSDTIQYNSNTLQAILLGGVSRHRLM